MTVACIVAETQGEKEATLVRAMGKERKRRPHLAEAIASGKTPSAGAGARHDSSKGQFHGGGKKKTLKDALSDTVRARVRA